MNYKLLTKSRQLFLMLVRKNKEFFLLVIVELIERMIEMKFVKPLDEVNIETIIGLNIIICEGVSPKGWQPEEVEEAEKILEAGVINLDQEEWIRQLFE